MREPTYAPSAMIIEAQRLARALPPVGTVERRRLPRRTIEGHHATRGNKQPLRYPMDDAALRIIIKDGIMDKGMPGTRDLSDADVTSLIAYLRASSEGRLRRLNGGGRSLLRTAL
jgi:hypothetical protein